METGGISGAVVLFEISTACVALRHKSRYTNTEAFGDSRALELAVTVETGTSEITLRSSLARIGNFGRSNIMLGSSTCFINEFTGDRIDVGTVLSAALNLIAPGSCSLGSGVFVVVT